MKVFGWTDYQSDPSLECWGVRDQMLAPPKPLSKNLLHILTSNSMLWCRLGGPVAEYPRGVSVKIEEDNLIFELKYGGDSVGKAKEKVWDAKEVFFNRLKIIRTLSDAILEE